MTRGEPVPAARCRQVCPCESLWFTCAATAGQASSAAVTSSSWLATARCSAVQPSTSGSAGSAPDSTSSSAACTWPAAAAVCSAVRFLRSCAASCLERSGDGLLSVWSAARNNASKVSQLPCAAAKWSGMRPEAARASSALSGSSRASSKRTWSPEERAAAQWSTLRWSWSTREESAPASSSRAQASAPSARCSGVRSARSRELTICARFSTLAPSRRNATRTHSATPLLAAR
mmetsp:Transcript_11408/g.34931  ORF Transcript_11408/g.34931 Transcript_11408/m.34931 type:complete len:233 (+) Transcript_11408:1500-2198(+)